MRGAQQLTPAHIACQQVLLDGATVFSLQWLILPARHEGKLHPEQLLARYLAHVRRATLSLVRPQAGNGGVGFLLLDSRVSLLTFSGPLLADSPHGTTATLRICGGLLVQPRQCHRGQLVFRAEKVATGIKVSLELSDYCPLLLGSQTPSPWRKLLYRLTQAHVHKIVTVRFLAMLHGELEGERGRVRVVPVTVRDGEDI